MVAAVAAAKPELGYTGERIRYPLGFDVRSRIYKVTRPRTPRATWTVKLKWDVFEDGVRIAETTALWLAERFIAQQESRIGRVQRRQ